MSATQAGSGAEHHVAIAAGHDVLRRQQKFLDRGGEASLQQDRFVVRTDLLEQLEILHVPGTDLNNVGLFEKQLDVSGVQNLAHDRKPRLLFGLH